MSDTTIVFALGDIECLITCHKLSEGIDIKSVSSIFLLSSDKLKLETIQRIGRCLRVDPDNRNKKATVVDFIRQQDPEKQLNPDQERRIWLAEVASTKCEKREDGTNS